MTRREPSALAGDLQDADVADAGSLRDSAKGGTAQDRGADCLPPSVFGNITTFSGTTDNGQRVGHLASERHTVVVQSELVPYVSSPVVTNELSDNLTRTCDGRGRPALAIFPAKPKISRRRVAEQFHRFASLEADSDGLGGHVAPLGSGLHAVRILTDRRVVKGQI